MAKSSLLRGVVNSNIRYFTTSTACNGKRNFRNINLYNFRGSYAFKKAQAENPDPDIPIHKYGVREPGYTDKNKKFHLIPEMVPELVVPDLTGCKLKPYVPYNVADVTQSEFTAKDLFDAVYSEKIHNDFHSGKLDENGNPKEANALESLTPEEAKIRARQTGSDIF